MLQTKAGLLRLGFVNTPAILIFMAQLPELNPRTLGWHMFLSLSGCDNLPVSSADTGMPTPLEAIFVVTAPTP